MHSRRTATLASARRPMAAWLLAAALATLPIGIGTAAAGPGLRQAIADSLVVPAETRLLRYRWQRPPELIALYFGADWCAPCHAFVPELRRVRDALRAAGADTEVVFVSLDESEPAMRRYMRLQSMPWPAVDPRRLPALAGLRRLGGPAPPNLVLIGRDGEPLAGAWDGQRYTGLAPVLRAWTARARADAAAR